MSDEVVRKAEAVVRAAFDDDMVVKDHVTYYGRDGGRGDLELLRPACRDS